MTTSIASAEGTSARSSCPTAGSPGAFVKTVVSSSGVRGRSIGCGRPSGRRRSSATNTRPGSTGSSPRRSLFPSVSAWRCRMSAAAMRTASALRFPSGARSIALASMPARWRDTRSDASASRSSASSARSVPSGISSSSASSLRVSSASCSPGFRESLVKPSSFSASVSSRLRHRAEHQPAPRYRHKKGD